MQKGIKLHRTTLHTNFLEAGESIEEKMRRVTQTNEPIDNTAPITYTERKDGVRPEFDFHTDKWEYAQNAMGKVTKTKIAKGQGVLGVEEPKEPQQPAQPTEPKAE